MCLILDTCCLSTVFSEANAGHSDFRPVFLWLKRGGALVIGGTQYRRELETSRRYHGIINELKRAGRVRPVNDGKVDNRQKLLQKEPWAGGCNDLHIIALVIESKCKLVCTNDRAAMPYITTASNYPGRRLRPKIYSRKEHAPLLLRTDCP